MPTINPVLTIPPVHRRLLQPGTFSWLPLIVSIAIVSFSGALKVYVAQIFLGIPVSLAAMATAGLITFSAYAFDRGIENEEDARRSPGFKKALIGLAILSCISSFILFPSFGLLLPFLITYLYSKGIAGFRLKGGAGGKNAVVGLTWAVLLFVLIGRLDVPALLVYGFFFAKSFVNTAIYDVRDREADLRAGIRTLPGVLSLTAFRALLLAVTGVSHIAIILAASVGMLYAGDIGMFSALYTGLYVLVYSSGFSEWRNGIVDGEWILYAIYSIFRAFFL